MSHYAYVSLRKKEEDKVYMGSNLVGNEIGTLYF